MKSAVDSEAWEKSADAKIRVEDIESFSDCKIDPHVGHGADAEEEKERGRGGRGSVG